MSLQYVIDGYNIINHPIFRSIHKAIKDDRKALLELIIHKRLCGSSKNRVIVVFDGYPKITGERIEDSDIDVIFSRKETADERIKGIVENSVNIKNIIVVSDDKEIQFFIRSTGARAMGVEEFIGLPFSDGRSAKSGGHLGKDKEDLIKAELTYSQMHKINEELKKIWLK